MKRVLVLVLVGAVALVAGCSRDLIAPGGASFSRDAGFLAAPDNDSTMADLSPIARHLIVALRDSTLRIDLARALKAQENGTLGIDLHDCDHDALAVRVLREGERRGAGGASLACTRIRQRAGMVLYMDRDRLRGWDGTTIPVVTAVSNPDRGLPVTFRGYRSATQMIDLPSDGSIRGPILVVLPYMHAQTAFRNSAQSPAVSVRELPAPEGRQARPTVAPAASLVSPRGQ